MQSQAITPDGLILLTILGRMGRMGRIAAHAAHGAPKTKGLTEAKPLI